MGAKQEMKEGRNSFLMGEEESSWRDQLRPGHTRPRRAMRRNLGYFPRTLGSHGRALFKVMK